VTWSGARRRKSNQGCVDVVLEWDGDAVHGIEIDECATDNIFVKVLNNRCKSHTLASSNPESIRRAPLIFFGLVAV
jgi:hypothetical protein